MGREDLKELEENTDHLNDNSQNSENEFVDESSAGTNNFRYIHSPSKKSGLLSKFKGRSSRAKLVIAGMGGSLALLTISIILIIVASLTIPHFAENIASYQFARTGRLLRTSVSQLNAERVAADIADEGTFRAKYKSLRSSTWGKLDKYRPDVVYKNMVAEEKIKFNYGEPQGALRRRPLLSVEIDGNKISVDDITTGKLDGILHPIEKYKGGVRFSAELDANLERSLGSYKSMVRSAVAKKIREDIGIKLYWWSNKGADYKNKTAAETDRLAQKEYMDKVHEEIDGSSPTGADDVAKQANEEQKAALDDPEQADIIKEREGGLADKPKETVIKGADNVAQNSFGATALGLWSTTYAIAGSACIIYEGSTESSGPTLDAQNTSLQRSYYSIASAADQQKAGDTTAEAVGASARKLGNAGASLPMQRAKGQSVDTSTYLSPQANAFGTYSVFDAFFGANSSVSNVLNDVAENLCPTFTKWQVALAEGGIEALIAFFTLGGSKAAQEGAAQAAKTAFRVLVDKIIASITTKGIIKGLFGPLMRFMVRQLGIAAFEAGATLAAKAIVLSKMNANYNGLARNQEFAVQVDEGANLHTNEINRKHFYGRPLTKEEVAKDNISNSLYIAEQKSNQSAWDRYINPKNGTSLLANFGIQFKSFAKNQSNEINLSKIFTGFSNMMSRIFGNVMGVGLRPAYASSLDEHNYGIVQFGFSGYEEDLIKTNPSYFPLANAEIVYNNTDKINEIKSLYGQCFDATLGTLLSDKKIIRNEDGTIQADSGDCSPNALSVKNDKYGDLVFRWRLAMRNEYTLDHLIGIQSPEEESSSSADTASDTAVEDGVSDESNPFLTCPVPAKTEIKNNFNAQRAGHLHEGSDILAPYGSPIYAVFDGEIKSLKKQEAYQVTLTREDGAYMQGNHLSKMVSNKTVNAGDVIGYVGQIVNPVNAESQPHLHFEWHPDSQGPVDPYSYLKDACDG